MRERGEREGGEIYGEERDIAKRERERERIERERERERKREERQGREQRHDTKR